MSSKRRRFNRTAIEEMLRRALCPADVELSETKRDDAVFHLTDWLEDLEDLIELYSRPQSSEPAEARRILIRFLLHAPEHIAEAAEILTGIGVERIFAKSPGHAYPPERSDKLETTTNCKSGRNRQ